MCPMPSLASPAVQPALVEEFPKSPLEVTAGDTVVLCAEAISTTYHNIVTWSHGAKTYSQYIDEEPFCEEVRLPLSLQLRLGSVGVT